MFIEYENRFDVLNEKPQSIPLELTQAQAIEVRDLLNNVKKSIFKNVIIKCLMN